MAPSRIGRVFFGGVLAYLASENLRGLDGRVKYARAKGVPVPELLVPAACVLLLVGSLGVATWRKPRYATAAVGIWFAGITPAMHDFWNAEEDRADEKNSFLLNLALLGAVLMAYSYASAEADATGE